MMNVAQEQQKSNYSFISDTIKSIWVLGYFVKITDFFKTGVEPLSHCVNFARQINRI